MASYRHIYVHLPFCEVICHYCDFYTARAKDARHEEFFAALDLDVDGILKDVDKPLAALYMGGGTPSVSPLPLLEKFIHKFSPWISGKTEVTLEANPTNITAENLAAWRDMGINRLSLGIQSLDEAVLKRLGRVHSGEQAKRALALAAEFIPNVSGDLIYGVPGQSEDQPAEHAARMAELGAAHISAYNLTLEPEHFLYARLPADTAAWAQIKKVAEALAARGFRHYEVSNFALPGRESRNNGNYWRGGPYLALGPSAHGFDGAAQRWKNVADWEDYVTRLSRGESPVAEREELSLDQRQIEVLFTSFRTSEGLDLAHFRDEFGVDLTLRHASLFSLWEKEGLGTLANGRFVLTFAGRMLADELVKKLL